MAQSQVATPVPDVGKLRPVLDYIPCETCLDMYTPEQDYYCAICPRLVRDIVVKRTALGTDEAVQVIAPEDFSMAKDLRDRIQQQELELQEAREKVAALARREGDLQGELARLSGDLVKVRREKEEAQLVPFEFVGVREGQREDALMEFGEEEEEAPRTTSPVTALAWEPAPEETGQPSEAWEQPPPPPAPETPEEPSPPRWEEVPAETAEETAQEAPSFQSTEELPPPMPVPAPAEPKAKPVPPPPTTDDAIARIEAEIAKIEEELQQVAEQEKELGGGEKKKPKKRKK